jgi:hypothetical protein
MSGVAQQPAAGVSRCRRPTAGTTSARTSMLTVTYELAEHLR